MVVRWIGVACILAVGCLLPVCAQAEEDLGEALDSLNAQVQRQAGELERARASNEELSERIRELERRVSKRPEGQDGTPDERLELLEQQASLLSVQQESLVEQLARRSEVSGYIELEFENFENTDSTFDAKAIDLVVRSHPTKRLLMGVEIEFERTATTAAGDRQGEVEVEQGWMQYSLTPWLQPRAGVVIVPFGRYNLEHFMVLQDLASRPIMMRRVVPTTWAEAGIGFTGSASLGRAGGLLREGTGLDYQVYLVNGLTDRFTDSSARGARGAFGSDNNNNKALVGRASVSSPLGIELGASAYSGTYDKGGDDSILGFALDGDYRWRGLRLRGEFALFDLDEGLNADGDAITRDLRGAYVESAYSFWPRFLEESVGRYMGDPRFTAVARWGFAEFDDDGDAGSGNNREERLTLGFNLRPVEQLVLKFEWQRNTSNNEALELGDRDGFMAAINASF